MMMMMRLSRMNLNLFKKMLKNMLLNCIVHKTNKKTLENTKEISHGIQSKPHSLPSKTERKNNFIKLENLSTPFFATAFTCENKFINN